MECPICLEALPLAKLQPCGHMACPRCIHKQLQHDARCSLCRQIMTGSTPQLMEFDTGRGAKNICFFKETDECAGFFIQAGDRVVIVSKVTAQSLADAVGIATDQELLAVNGLPCYTSGCTTQILKKCTRVDLWVQERPCITATPTVSHRPLRFFRQLRSVRVSP